MKARWLLAGAVLAGLAGLVGGTGAQQVPAPMPRQAGADAAEARGRGEVSDPYQTASGGGDEKAVGGERNEVPSFDGEAGEWENVAGSNPLAGRGGSAAKGRDEAARAAAREAELAALPPAEKVEYPERFATETVCGPDNRTQITATTTTPWRWNCQLIVTLNNNAKVRGTGWFAGPCLVMTAGHCVFSHAAGGWAKSVEVIPGKNGAAQPFGSVTVGTSRLRAPTGWTGGKSGNPDFDYGGIILPDSSLGNRVGWFGFANLSDGELNGLLVNTAGYPGDKPFGTQWFMADKVTSVTSRRIFYMIDTFGGQSGSAVWRLKDGQRHAVGIHAYGGCPNGATRINSDVFAQMLAWRNQCK
jgi:V8-like Glu-specific endopeptidase